MKKALLIVDMLNDFVNEDGKLPVPKAGELVENIQKLMEKADIVVYANDAHAEDDLEFKVWPPHCVKGTYGAELVKELAPRDKAVILEKQDLSVFTNKDADRTLKNLGVNELYVVGVATEYCVRGAVLEIETKYGTLVKGAIDRGYKVNLVVDAIAGVDKITLPDGVVVPETFGKVNKTLLEMGKAGAEPLYTAQALEEMVK